MKIIISYNKEAIDCKIAVKMLHKYYTKHDVVLTPTIAYHDRFFISCDKLYVIGHYLDSTTLKYLHDNLGEQLYYYGNSYAYILKSDTLGRLQERHSSSVKSIWTHLYKDKDMPPMLSDLDKVVSMRFLSEDSRECLTTYYGLMARYYMRSSTVLYDVFTKKYRDGKTLEAGETITRYLKATTPSFMSGILRGYSAKYYNSHSYDYFLQEDDGCEIYVGWVMLPTGEIHYKLYSTVVFNSMLRICHDLGGVGRGRFGEIKTKARLWDLYGN